MLRQLETRTRVKASLLAPILGLAVFVGVLSSVLAPVAQAATTSSNLNFQARLLSNTGAVVPDGNYNIDFKLYTADSTTGSVGTCTGACVWEETRKNFSSTGVQVINGYFSVNLGSVTAFGSTINWDQQLWLTMNIGGTSVGASPSWDGEMQNAGHSIALTALPYSFVAGQLAKTSGSNRGVLSFNTVANNPNLTLPDVASGTVCLQSATACGFALSTIDLQGVYANSSTPATITTTSSTKTLLFKAGNTFDSTSFLQVQNAAGTDIFNIDTVNNKVGTANQTGVGVNSANLNIKSGDASGAGANSGNVVIDSGTATGTTGSVSLANGSATVINIAANNLGHTIHIGDGATSTTQNITIGSAGTTGSILTLQAGTGATALSLLTGASGGSAGGIQIGNTTGANTQTINIGTNSTSGSSTTVVIGSTQSGGTTLQSVGGVTVTSLGAADNANYLCRNTSNIIATCTGAVATAFIQNGNSFGVDAVLGTNDNQKLSFETNNLTQATINPGGATLFKNTTDSAAAFQVQNTSAVDVFTIDTTNSKVGTANKTTASTNSANLVIKSGDASGATSNSGNVTIDAGTATGTAGTVSLANANATTINIAANNGTHAIHIGDGATSTTQNITIGSAGTTGSLLTLQAGTGATALSLLTGASGGSAGGIQIGNTTGANTQTINIGTNATASSSTTVTIGSTVGASPTTIQAGTSGVLVKPANSTTAFQVQNAAGNNYIQVDTSGANLYLGNGGIASTIQVGNTTGAVAQTINIGNNATASSSTAINIGSAVGTSLTTINGGTSGIKLIPNGTGNTGVLVKPTNNSTSAFQVQPSGSTTPVLNVDTTNNRVGINTASPGASLSLNSGTADTSGLQFTQLTNTSPVSSSFSQLLGLDSSGNVGLSSAGISLTSPALAYWDGANNPTTGSQSYPLATLSGNAVYDSAANGVRLTSNTNSQSGSMNWNFSQVNFEETQFQFKAGGGTGADSTWFYSYADATPTTEYGSGFTKGYLIYFSEYHHCVGIAYGGYSDGNQCGSGGGTNPLTSAKLYNIADNVFHAVDIQLRQNVVIVRWDSKVVLSYTDVYTRDLANLNFGFGSRTGGSNNNHYIKGLLVTKLGTNASQYNVEDTSPLASNLTWDNANERLGIGSYNPDSTLDVHGTTSFKSIITNAGTVYQGTGNIAACTATGTSGYTANTTVTGSGTSFSSSGVLVGDTIVLPDGTKDTITAVGSNTSLTVSTSRLECVGSYKIIREVFSTADSNVQIGSSTTDARPILIALDSYNNATDPTEVDGGMYYNTALNSFRCGRQGVWSDCMNGLSGSNTAESTARNSCTTSCASFDVSGTTVPANYCQAGRVIHILARGVYSSTGTPTLLLGVYYGTSASNRASDTLLSNGVAVSTGTSQSDKGWELDFTIICFSTTSMNGQGRLNLALSSTGISVVQYSNSSNVTVTSSSDKNLYLFPVWSASSASNTITLEQWIVN